MPPGLVCSLFSVFLSISVSEPLENVEEILVNCENM